MELSRRNINDLEMAKKIAERVAESGGKTYFVGGYVRDRLLNRENKDIDIEIHGITPDCLKNILSEFGNIRVQGASFGVYNIQGCDIDIVLPRKETCTGRGHKDFEVYVDPFIGTRKAAERRDFTINALMQDVLTGEIIDEFGGLRDIRDGIIRHVNDTTFREDPLRVFRAAQFSARLGFRIAEDTEKLMSEMDVSELSKERVYEETVKALMKSECPSVYFEALKRTDKLKEWFPELIPLIGSTQSPEYHPEGDVWVHTMMVLDAAASYRDKTENPEYYMWSTLCHDLGKPATRVEDEKGIHNYGHDRAGMIPAAMMIHRLTSGQDLFAYTQNIVELHMKAHDVSKPEMAGKRFCNDVLDRSVCPEDLAFVTLADSRGSMHDEAYLENKLKNYSDRLAEYRMLMEQPQVTGQDLLDMGLRPGPLFREILEDAHHKFLSGKEKKENLLAGIRTRAIKAGLIPEPGETRDDDMER